MLPKVGSTLARSAIICCLILAAISQSPGHSSSSRRTIVAPLQRCGSICWSAMAACMSSRVPTWIFTSQTLLYGSWSSSSSNNRLPHGGSTQWDPGKRQAHLHMHQMLQIKARTPPRQKQAVLRLGPIIMSTQAAPATHCRAHWRMSAQPPLATLW